jgi:nucleotide-binding universal stress UspA family protein
MLQRIYVATDFSPAAGRALARAALIGRRTGAALTVLHVLPERALLDRAFNLHEIDYERMVAGAEHALRDALDQLERTHGVKAGSALLHGAAHRVIAAAAPPSKADMVVIGTRGERESGAETGRLGGTALKCYLATAVPLLLVRNPAVEDYGRVLAAVDDSDAARFVLASALAVSAEAAVCEALHAFEVPFAARLRAQNVKEATIAAYAAREREHWERNLAALTRELGAAGRIRPVVVAGEAIPTVMHEIERRRPDLVVVGKQTRYSRIADAQSFDSVSLDIGLHASSDVLVIP